MRLLFDTNVILDVLLDCEPWVGTAKDLWRANDQQQITGFLTATTLTDIFYVARRTKDLSHARSAILVCLAAFEICPVERADIERAIDLPGTDFEDNLQIAVALKSELDAIVTRNPADYGDSPITVMTPDDVINRLA